MAAPFFAYYEMARSNPNFSNPWDLMFLAELHSLEPSDLLRSLESNVLYIENVINLEVTELPLPEVEVPNLDPPRSDE